MIPVPTRRSLAPVWIALALASGLRAQEPASVPSVLVHPLFDRTYWCTEHPEGQLAYPGDALGSDCVVTRFVESDGRKWGRTHKGRGKRNEDWYGWGEAVRAPFDGVVEKVSINPVTNQPGLHQGGRASILVVRRSDGVRVMLAHVQDARVCEGETVAAGQVVATVGNNGQSWHPHIHIGAWKGDQPLQVRFDLRALGKIYRDF